MYIQCTVYVKYFICRIRLLCLTLRAEMLNIYTQGFVGGNFKVNLFCCAVIMKGSLEAIKLF